MDTRSAAASGRLAVPTPQRAKTLALGFEPVLADWYWIQAVQLVGGSTGESEDSGRVGALIDVVTGLDPWVDHPYRFAGLWLDDDLDAVRHANRLLAKGIAYHPLEWRNRFYLGYNLFFHLEDYAAAADALEPALPLDSAPSYLGALVARLRAASDSLDTAAIFLQQLASSTEDEHLRKDYLGVLEQVETERLARRLDAARAEFRRRHGRDLREPSELWAGALRVLPAAPPAHPSRRDAKWRLDPDGELVSSVYGKRYRIHVHPSDREQKPTDGAADEPIQEERS